MVFRINTQERQVDKRDTVSAIEQRSSSDEMVVNGVKLVDEKHEKNRRKISQNVNDHETCTLFSPNRNYRGKIDVLSAPCARGKTRNFAVPYMLANPDQKFIFVSPLIDLLCEVEEQIENITGLDLGLDNFAYGPGRLWARLDSQKCKKVGNAIREHFDQSDIGGIDWSARIVGITHQAINLLSDEQLADRVMIVDETPEFISVWGERTGIWDMHTRSEDKGGNGSIKEQAGQISLTLAGRLLMNAAAGGDYGNALGRFLRKINSCPTYRLDEQKVWQQIDPKVIIAAQRVILMSARPNARYLLEWAAYNSIEVGYMDAEEHGLDVSPHRCVNVEIFYAEDTGRRTSKTALSKGLAKQLGSILKPLRESGGSMAGGNGYIVAINKSGGFYTGLAKAFKKSRILSPTVRGVNEHKDCDRAYWLAAIQPDKTVLDLIKRKFPIKRGRDQIIHDFHIEALYQFVFRTILRTDENAHVKIFVPTKKDADELAAILGTDKVSQCSGMPKHLRPKNMLTAVRKQRA